MVIRQTYRIPEVRLYPPEDNDRQPGPNVVQFGGVGSRGNPAAPASWTTVLSATDSVASDVATDCGVSSDQLGSWVPFHMRPSNLAAFIVSQNSYRSSYRAQNIAIQRVRSGWVSSAAKSLDLVRQNLQQFINKELDEVIRRYIDKFFTPAVENIRRNNGDNSVSDEHIQMVCRQILDDAKRMYSAVYTRGSTPVGDYSDSETGSHSEGRASLLCHRKSPSSRKRKDSDTDSEASQTMLRPFKKKGRPPLALSGGISGRQTPHHKVHKPHDPVKREGPKWDPSRLKKDILFVMGARANKALGFGQTRGRLYMKHPEIFKYGGDSEDKQWLHDNNLMPATGGKAYMLVLEDIRDLAESEEYRNSPGVMIDDLVGFTVPDSMLEKMKVFMESLRTDSPEKANRGRSVQRTLEAIAEAEVPVSPERFTNKDSETPTGNEYSGTGLANSERAKQVENSPADNLDLLGGDPSPARPFTLATGLEDVSPASEEVLQTSSDLRTVIKTEPPMSAPFDVTECP